MQARGDPTVTPRAILLRILSIVLATVVGIAVCLAVLLAGRPS
jgi:hypothetical protein